MAINESLEKYIGIKVDEGLAHERAAKDQYTKLFALREKLEKEMKAILKDSFVEVVIDADTREHLSDVLEKSLSGFDDIDDYLEVLHDEIFEGPEDE